MEKYDKVELHCLDQLQRVTNNINYLIRLFLNFGAVICRKLRITYAQLGIIPRFKDNIRSGINILSRLIVDKMIELWGTIMKLLDYDA